MTYKQFKIGGKDRGLKFNLGALKHIGDITGNDPLAFTLNESPADQFRFVFTIVYAGLLANADAKKQEPDFSKDDVESWVKDLEMPEAVEIIKFFTAAYNVGGGSSDTQG